MVHGAIKKGPLQVFLLGGQSNVSLRSTALLAFRLETLIAHTLRFSRSTPTGYSIAPG
jgi:hypothetical protein